MPRTMQLPMAARQTTGSRFDLQGRSRRLALNGGA